MGANRKRAGGDRPVRARGMPLMLFPLERKDDEHGSFPWKLFAGFAQAALFHFSDQRFIAKGVAPSRGRGSKLETLGAFRRQFLSPLRGGVDRNVTEHSYADLAREVAPSRGRGSKRNGSGCSSRRSRRPFAGAWIETSPKRCTRSFRVRSPLRGGVDRNY